MPTLARILNEQDQAEDLAFFFSLFACRQTFPTGTVLIAAESGERSQDALKKQTETINQR
jgi:hypothetical protein